MLGEGVAPAGDDLQDEDAEAENVGFRREDAVQDVLRRHVPAAFSERTACQDWEEQIFFSFFLEGDWEEQMIWLVFRLVPGPAASLLAY